jgi:hypothetical protein
MYTNYQPGQIGSERQRDMLARAEQQRQARWLRTLSKAEQPEQHPGRAVRPMAGLWTVIPRLTRRLAARGGHRAARSAGGPQV